ncbi:4-hydroxy-tetrahydrodipicolinate synthase [Mesoterricola sediminis]|uniref:4-hydroxy-tetrahydrodipicolinate synthase n=1 Tax=Mesoterricola sediminis TaxID=2927980 RepID=A0AA48GQL5_9BACT|nr:4-hydroxy-tetrahydrodipicolinate synthase [Mesoterricola sediminis]BDU75789.1 4-hydroxy-tetrahydrodipicolinate synthase [Mesoterricola sediminis]
MTFTGLWVALATPFTSTGDVDLPAFRRLVRHVAAGGADGVVVLGSTGEAATILDPERDALVEACLESAGPMGVVVGTGSNATRQTAEWTRRAQAQGARGALVVTPYYNKPTPEGLRAHYEAVAWAAPGLPLIAYNVPGRTGLNLTPAALAGLWENPQVAAVKESSGNLAQIAEIARTLPPGKILLSGDDNLALPSIAVGASGLVSVLGNAVPRETAALVRAALEGRRAEAIALHQALLPLMDALFAESNPIPLKAALERLGLCGSTLRLPLTSASQATRDRLASLLPAGGAA